MNNKSKSNDAKKQSSLSDLTAKGLAMDIERQIQLSQTLKGSNKEPTTSAAGGRHKPIHQPMETSSENAKRKITATASSSEEDVSQWSKVNAEKRTRTIPRDGENDGKVSNNNQCIVLFTNLSDNYKNACSFAKMLAKSFAGVFPVLASPLRRELGGFMTKWRSQEDVNRVLAAGKERETLGQRPSFGNPLRKPMVRNEETNQGTAQLWSFLDTPQKFRLRRSRRIWPRTVLELKIARN